MFFLLSLLYSVAVAEHVCIVGAGIGGASTAYYYSKGRPVRKKESFFSFSFFFFPL
jgi:hypothetical protein